MIERVGNWLTFVVYKLGWKRPYLQWRIWWYRG
jgi:hypothetical protein